MMTTNFILFMYKRHEREPKLHPIGSDDDEEEE